MKLKTYSYRYAEEILQHTKYINAYNELLQICKNTPIPVYKNKSSSQKNLDIVQQLLNTYFSIQFERLGWTIEPPATPDSFSDSLRSDFRKTFTNNNSNITLQIEVEFGNAASYYRNYFKFQLSYSHDLADVCILIVPCQKLSSRIDRGLGNFEKIVREIPSAKLSITVPILVIGLDIEGENEWNVKSIENDLNIIKGSKKEYVEKHRKLIYEYISKL